MDASSQILQFGGSLIAIFALFLLARALKLGGKPRLQSAEEVKHAAAEVIDGFEAVRTSIARDGKAALASDKAGQIMLIKLHGNHFAGRILTQTARVREEVDGLIVESGETQFGKVRMSLSDPAYWADAINRL